MLRFATLLLIFPLAANAQTIYKCTDAGGGTVITNTRQDRNCKAVVVTPDNTLPAPRAKTPTPAGFPRVGEETQKARDGDRRLILEQELAGEQRNLEQTRRDLAEQEKAGPAGDRLTPYRERVGQHERNIQALQKELGNLK